MKSASTYAFAPKSGSDLIARFPLPTINYALYCSCFIFAYAGISLHVIPVHASDELGYIVNLGVEAVFYIPHFVEKILHSRKIRQETLFNAF